MEMIGRVLVSPSRCVVKRLAGLLRVRCHTKFVGLLASLAGDNWLESLNLFIKWLDDK